MRSSHHILLRSGASLLVAGAILVIAYPALASVRANYVEVASWDTGYQAQYTITNDGPGSVTGWRVIFDLPAGSSPSSSWDSVRGGSSQHLIFDNAAWNGALAPGSHTTFGFVIVGLARPVGCTINGGPCDTLAPLAAAPRRTTIRVASFDAYDATTPVEHGTMLRAPAAAYMQLDTAAMDIHIASIELGELDECDNDASRAGVVDTVKPVKQQSASPTERIAFGRLRSRPSPTGSTTITRI